MIRINGSGISGSGFGRLGLPCSTALIALTLACALRGATADTVPQAAGSDPAASAPADFTVARTGDVHDFDYLLGAWTTQQRRLKARGVGSSEWVESPPNEHCAHRYMDGLAIVEESRFPNQSPAGLFLYTFSVPKKQWAIFWINSKTGQPDPPDVGGFEGKLGRFYAVDVDNGKPIKVRITWTQLDHDHARWEQAFSYDNHTWETNWISEFTRGDPTLICPKP
jgi:hypothetical protein